LKRRLLHIGMDGMNYPLLRGFLAEGCLPTFARLIDRGTINRLLPSIPAWTPTNWAAQVTGAQPGTHGLGGWTRRHKSDPLSARPIESWESRDWIAETVWQVAEEAGLRSLITNYPVATWPSPVRDGYVVAPGFREPPFVLANSGEYYASATHAEPPRSGEKVGALLRTVDRLEEGPPPGSRPVPLLPASGWRSSVAIAPSQGQAWEAALPVPLSGGGEETCYLLFRERDLDRAFIYAHKDDPQPLAELSLGRWSPFVIRNLGSQEASLRWRLLANAPGPALHLCRSQAYATTGFTYPESLAPQLVREVGPFFGLFTVYPRGQAELEAFLDDVAYQGYWELGVARYLQAHYGWDLHFCHWHIFDNINHPTVNAADPEGPHYDPQVGAWNMEAQRRCYRIADDVLAGFLELADEDTVVMVVSDHGMPPAHRWADINARLAECGLLYMDPSTRRIDFSRSQVYTWPERGAEIFVNLAGREPMGIVPPSQYEAVQEMIIDALLDWRDPATGKRVIPLALKLQDAQIIGYWGSDNGDVVCSFNHGMGWGAVPGGTTVGPGKGALHGSQLPTYETKYFSTMGTMILAGAGVRGGGYERDWQQHGLIREIDVASTICHLLGLRMPLHNQGAVPMDLMM